MVLPHLQYCLLNWGNFKGDRNLGLRDRLLTLQKCLVRIVSGADRISHADPLFANLAAHKVDDLFAQSVRVFSYQMSKDMLPGILATYLRKSDHGHATRAGEQEVSFLLVSLILDPLEALLPEIGTPFPWK